MLTVPAHAVRGKDLRKMTVDELAVLAGCTSKGRKASKDKRRRDYYCASPAPIAIDAVARLPRHGRTYATETMKSQLEVDYAAYLESLRMAGEILTWAYERVSIHLADNTSYKPDFLVITQRGKIEMHETKGFWREKDWIKFKTAAAQNPWFSFVSVMRAKDGSWNTHRYDDAKEQDAQ